MGKRSRRGCRECKRSRIKCDEVWPQCGTCRRRDRICPGYSTPADQSSGLEGINIEISTLPVLNETFSADSGSLVTSQDDLSSNQSRSRPSFSRDGFDERYDWNSTETQGQLSPMLIPVVPGYGELDANDRIAINYYFQHHLRRVGLGDEFVEDGNAKVLALFQQYPDIIGDIVYAIGHTHVSHIDSKSLVPALTRKSRALAKLRSNNPEQQDFLEPKLLLAVGIGALELIDTDSIPQISAIPALLAYVADMVITQQTSAPLGDLAKYFLRALARQDIIFALTYRRRNLIPTSLWLDGSCLDDVDRFLGLTMTLMPLLEELCALAEDMKAQCQQLQDSQLPEVLSDGSLYTQDNLRKVKTVSGAVSNSASNWKTLDGRIQSIRRKISTWRPFINDTTSFLEMRKYLLQAQAFRSAALLYLHRLCHPAGANSEADAIAINMAYDVLLSCHEDHADVRMILWPLFVSGCEVRSNADRQLVLNLLDRNHRDRGTYTPLKAAEFLVQCLWPAVDSKNMSIDWMDLLKGFPGDFAPL